MIRISKETDYGILLLSHLAGTSKSLLFSARELADETGLPLPMVSKILKTLARRGMLISQRGSKGGYALSRSASQISVAEVIAAMDGPFAMTECIVHPGDCRQEHTCRVRHNWARINSRVKRALETVSIAEMGSPRESLVALEAGMN